MNASPDSAAAAPPGTAGRRNVLTSLLAAGLGALAGLAPLIPGVAFVLDPLVRRRRNGGSNSAGAAKLKVVSLSALAPDGAPRLFSVRTDKYDAWNKFPDTEVGAVFLSLQPDGSVSCFNARCPHLGCTINFSESARQFVCPCHASSFSATGERSNGIPPRNMDPLTAEVRDGDVWVQFHNFRAGTPERIPIA
jgi:Rieske Fe-S protein